MMEGGLSSPPRADLQIRTRSTSCSPRTSTTSPAIQSLEKNTKDDKGYAELGAYYMLKGNREKAEEMFDRSFALESGEVWNTSMIAGSYLGVKPQE